MKVGIIQFPGTNCFRESSMAVKRAGMESVPLLWNEDPSRMESCDGFILAGGFSYEDRSRSGIIAALDPLMDTVKKAVSAGKPVLGICNGAQILVEANLVPGFATQLPAAALTTNKRVSKTKLIGTGFYNAWINLRCELQHGAMDSRLCAFTMAIPQGEVLRIPTAHTEGRFILADDVLQAVRDLNLIPFRYADDQGDIDPSFPVNPNGSVDNIAALTNYAGNVMAVMPHPERTSAGDPLFTSMRMYMEGRRASAEPITLPPALTIRSIEESMYAASLTRYIRNTHAEEIVTELIITDNAAVSVENTLQQLGIPVTVTRRMHWEITFSQDISADEQTAILESVHGCGELYNSNKERLIRTPDKTGSWSVLVRERDDICGLHAHQALTSWFSISGITSVRRGTIWDLSAESGSISEVQIQQVLDTHILMNPHAHKGYIYEG